MIKVLTLDDWDSLAIAIKSLPYHRVAQTRQHVSEEEFLKYTYAIFRAPNSTVYGYYNDTNELTSMISVVGFSQMPAYAVYNWRNLKPESIISQIKYRKTASQKPIFYFKLLLFLAVFRRWVRYSLGLNILNNKLASHLWFSMPLPHF